MTTRIQSAADMAMAFGGPPTVWTPELWDSSNSGAEGQTYGANNGAHYFRVGDFVMAWGRLTMTGLGTLAGTDNARIGNFPYKPNNASFKLDVSFHLNMALSGAYAVGGYASTAVPAFLLRVADTAAADTNLNINELTATSDITFSCWYFTDDPF